MSGARNDLQRGVVETNWGGITIEADAHGVVACHLPEVKRDPAPLRVKRIRLPRRPHPGLQQAVVCAKAMLEGRKPRKKIELSAAAWTGATEFQRAIWSAMRRIPRGRAVTYAELARQAGRPKAVRATGGACGANPLPLFVPCHRVVAAGGRPGGFTGGLGWKRLLLAGEGVAL